MSLAGRPPFAFCLMSSAVKLPCVLHHQGEVLVVVERSTDVVVVLVELSKGDLAVLFMLVPLRKEVGEDVLL